jgi:hypothetical protein
LWSLFLSRLRIAATSQVARAGNVTVALDIDAQANLNEFTEALVDFKEAYRLLPDPVLLYNLGQCERQLGRLEEAIRFYRSFLREQPKAPNRQDVTHKIDEIEATRKARQAEADKSGAPPEEADPGAAPDGTGKEAKTSAASLEMNQPPRPVPSSKPTRPLPVAHSEVQSITPTSRVADSPAPIPLAVPPVNPEITDSGQGKIDLTTAPAATPAAENPAFYSRWWFWTAAGVMAAGAGVGIYAATANKAPAVPSSTLGSKGVF